MSCEHDAHVTAAFNGYQRIGHDPLRGWVLCPPTEPEAARPHNPTEETDTNG